jgi:hypoxanthine phosphoribosyltransferase
VTALDQTQSYAKCFVIMPTGNRKEYTGSQREADFIFHSIIAPAVRLACGDGVEITRESDSATPGAIDKRIVINIANADLAIVDLTGHNANVFLELGMRYCLRRSTTILLKQTGTTIPFDISGYRSVEYDPFYDGIERARLSISDAITAASRSSATDSLVYNTYPNLTVNVSQVHEPSALEKMRWEDFWSRLTSIEALLKPTLDDRRYHPDVLLGLSNGGMFVADMLGRRLFDRTPIASFWVNRHEREWFENPLNVATISALVAFQDAKAGQPLEVLLVDDIVASGNTMNLAIRFLEQHLSSATISFLPLFSADSKFYQPISKHIIWNHKAFSAAYSDQRRIEQIHATQSLMLPYEKHMRSN